MELTALGKLNLTLDVLRERDDGYHELQMVMQTVGLGDTLTLEPADEGVRVKTNLSFLPEDGRNLAVMAAEKFCAAAGIPTIALKIFIEKRIPVCAGMAGGSTDAAAVLRGLNQLTGLNLPAESLEKIGQSIGSDVPYCVQGGTALAEGRGEVLTRLTPLPRCHVVLCKPAFSISTPMLFGQIRCQKSRRRPDTAGVLSALEAGDLHGVAHRMFNVFEDVLPPKKQVEISEIKHVLIDCGALGSSMTGTGPTVFGLFDCLEYAQRAQAELTTRWANVFLTTTV